MYVIFRLNFLFGKYFRLFRTHFEPIESLAINTDDSTLRHKGMRVYIVDNTEDNFTLTTLCQHEEHLHVATGIESLSIYDSTSAMRLLIYTFTYLMIFLRDDEELYGTTHGVYLITTEAWFPAARKSAINF